MPDADKKTILLAEDEAIIALAEKRTLEDYGYEVLTAPSGEEAVTMAVQNESIRLILMDIGFSRGISGPESARRILAKKNLPIIFLTAHSEKDSVEGVAGIRHYGYVLKNSGDHVLRSSIEMALALFEAHQKGEKNLEALRETEEKYRLLVELSPDLIAVHDQKEIIYINPAGLKMLEASSAEEVLGKNVLEFLSPEDHSKAIERIGRLQKEGSQSPLYEHRLFTLKGQEKEIEVTGIPFTLGGRPAIQIIAYDVTQRKQIERTLLDHQKALQTLALRMEEIEEMERKRIARTLHDLVGQKLATLNLHLDIFAQLLPEEIKRELSGRMDESRQLVEEITRHTREIITELRPAVLDDFGLVAALHWYGKQFSERTGIRTRVGADPLNYNMPPEMETIVFRIAQEALTNITKHARADQVEITLVSRSDALELVISDNGLGFRFEGFYSGSEKGGWGLTFMKERAVNLGGDLQIESQPGKGTTFTLFLPIVR